MYKLLRSIHCENKQEINKLMENNFLLYYNFALNYYKYLIFSLAKILFK